MSEPDSRLDWALHAAKLRFGPHVVLREDGTKKTIFLERPGEAPRALGSAETWPEAMIDAVKHNADIPQPSITSEASPPPEGEEFIEEFCQAMRQRDLATEFLLWYGERSDRDPHTFPRALDRKRWLEWFGSFITGYEEE